MDQNASSTSGENHVSPSPRSVASQIEVRRAELQRNLVVVHDSLQECPYREAMVARMPLEYPRRQLSASDLDQLLEDGYRRTGTLLYRTQCPSCQECIPIRVKVGEFEYSKSMRRILNRAEREIDVQWSTPQLDLERLRLFNAHRAERQLTRRGPADLSDYHEFLIASCVETKEIAFRHNGQLIGVAIVDFGNTCLNAVYTHFDPAFGRFSIGTLAVLLQIQKAEETNRELVYLGLYVAENDHLNYKSRFQPQERLIEGKWHPTEAI